MIETQNNSLVSIIMPTFNRAYILPSAIDSVLKQTYQDWELIIVDDGSTDGTLQLIQNFNDSRIKYHAQEHKGPSAARNYAFTFVEGEWIAYLDSDNELFPDYLKEMVENIEGQESTLYALPKGVRTLELYYDNKLVETIDDSSDFPPKLEVKDLFLRNIHFDINGFMHSRKIIEDGIRFDEEMYYFEDWDFVLYIADKYKDNFLYVPQVLFHYHQRYGTDSLVSNSSYVTWAEAFERVYKKHRHSELMIGQEWYPDRVIKNKELEKKFERGEVPPYYLRLF